MTGYFDQLKQMVGGGPSGAHTHTQTYDLTGGGRRRRGTRSRSCPHCRGTRSRSCPYCRHKKSAAKHHKRYARRGGSVVTTAALPFSLLAVQKLFQTRKGRKNLKKMNKSVRRTARRVRRTI